jgi:hypothetical protein
MEHECYVIRLVCNKCKNEEKSSILNKIAHYFLNTKNMWLNVITFGLYTLSVLI